jgi:hypothetical protein
MFLATTQLPDRIDPSTVASFHHTIGCRVVWGYLNDCYPIFSGKDVNGTSEFSAIIGCYLGNATKSANNILPEEVSN